MTLAKSLWGRRLTRTLCVGAVLVLTACSSPEEKADAFYKSGTELLASGDFRKAALEFRNALKYNDKLTDAWFGLYTAEEKAADLGGALLAIERVVELDPNRVDARVALTRYLLASAKFDRALSNINAANELKPNDPDIVTLRASTLFKLNDRKGARAEAERAIALAPDKVDALAILAADRMADSDYAGALKYLDEGLAKEPSNLGLLLFKVSVYESTRDDGNLEKTLRKIVETNPSDSNIRLVLLNFLKSRKKFVEAESELRALVEANPTDQTYGLELVRLVGESRGPAAVRMELEKLLKSQPDAIDYRLASAELDSVEGKTKAATDALEAIIASDESKENIQKARNLLASVFLRDNKIAEARSTVDTILAEDPKNANALALRANLKIDANDTSGAISDARAALSEAPQSVPLLKLLSRAYQLSGQPDLAEEALGQAVKTSNFAPPVVLEYQSYLLGRGKKEQAETLIVDAVRLHPDDRGLLAALAKAYIDKQDWAGAEEVAAKLRNLQDASGLAEDILATSLIGQQRFDESINLLRSRQNAATSAAQPMNNLVVAYLRAGRMADAESFLKSVLEVNDRSTEAYMLMALVKRSQGDVSGAELNYQKAIDTDPDNAALYVELARLQVEQNLLDKANATLKVALAKSPGNADANVMLANLLEQRNEIEAAIGIYEEQLKLTPGNLIVINNLASLLADHRTDRAEIDRAYAISQRLEGLSSPYFKDTRGWIAYRRGEFREAEKLLSQAVTELPKLPIVRYHLGMTYAALNRPKDAEEQFKAGISMLSEKDPLKAKFEAGLASVVSGQAPAAVE